mgnify:CR=1 FL=1
MSLKKEKNIRKEVVLKAIEESLVQACKHHFGKSDNIVVNMDYNTGEYEINMAKEVVENVEDQQTQISLPNAKILDKRAVYGSTVYVKVNSKEFGRIAAQIAKAIIPSEAGERKKIVLFMKRYKLMERDLVSGVISRHFERRGEDGKSTTVNVSVNLGKAEATLMAGEQIKGEEYKVNTRMKFYVVEVKDLPKGPKDSSFPFSSGVSKRDCLRLRLPRLRTELLRSRQSAERLDQEQRWLFVLMMRT